MATGKHNIEEIKLLMPDYVMGRLDPEDMKAVGDAIESSPAIKSLFNEVSGTIGFVKTVKFDEPAPQYWVSLLPKIHERIEELEEKRFSWTNVVSYLPAKALAKAGWKFALPAAAVILIAILYFTIFINQPDTTITEDKKELINKDTMNEPKKKDEIKKELVKENEKKEQRNDDEQNIKVQKRRVYREFDGQLTKIKEDQMEKKDGLEKKEDITGNEEFTSADLEEEMVFSGGAAGGFDEETEDELNRLSDNEQEKLIKELINSNL
jgi:hypothetical protein